MRLKSINKDDRLEDLGVLEDSIQMGFEEMGYEVADWIHLAQDKKG
jgi:hypothetical protein